MPRCRCLSPGNFWIAADEIGDLKEQASQLIVPFEGSSLIIPRQSPGLWKDDLSLATDGDLVHEGDCLRVNDPEMHMIVWPPLLTPHLNKWSGGDQRWRRCYSDQGQ